MFSQILGNSTRLQSLDFLRGCAITIVFLTHFGVFDLHSIGVDLFFVLSGHLVSVSLFSTLKKSEGKTSYKIFFIKRLFRILPSYYTFLIIGYGLAWVLLKDISPSDIPLPKEFSQYFFFYRNYGGPPSRWSMEHLWSLCVEEQFYWILPILLAFFSYKIKRKENQLLASALVLLAAGLVLKGQAMVTDFAEWPTYTHNRLDAFGWGILLTVFRNDGNYYGNKIFDKQWLIYAGVSILTICLTFLSPLPELVLRTISPFCWFFVIAGIYHTSSKTFIPLRLLAFFSYGIYLWHFLFVIPVQHYFGKGWLGFVIYTICTIVFAVLSTILIERPFLIYRDRFLKMLFPTKSQSILKSPEVPIP